MGKRLITQRRGRGFGRYKSPRHLRFTNASHPRIREGVGTIVDFVHEAGRIAPLAKVSYDGHEEYMIAPDGAFVGPQVTFGVRGAVEAGNTTPLGHITQGTSVYNTAPH